MDRFDLYAMKISAYDINFTGYIKGTQWYCDL